MQRLFLLVTPKRLAGAVAGAAVCAGVVQTKRRVQAWSEREAAEYVVAAKRAHEAEAALWADIVGPCRHACEECGVAPAQPWFTGRYMGRLPICHDGTLQFCADCMPKKFCKDTNPWEPYCGV